MRPTRTHWRPTEAAVQMYAAGPNVRAGQRVLRRLRGLISLHMEGQRRRFPEQTTEGRVITFDSTLCGVITSADGIVNQRCLRLRIKHTTCPRSLLLEMIQSDGHRWSCRSSCHICLFVSFTGRLSVITGCDRCLITPGTFSPFLKGDARVGII